MILQNFQSAGRYHGTIEKGRKPKKRRRWKQHIDAWAASGKTQIAYWLKRALNPSFPVLGEKAASTSWTDGYILMKRVRKLIARIDGHNRGNGG